MVPEASSISTTDDIERARKAKARMTPQEREAFGRLLEAFPGSKILDTDEDAPEGLRRRRRRELARFNLPTLPEDYAEAERLGYCHRETA